MMAAAFSGAVCKIEIVDARNGGIIRRGTGFHYGSGWVMSNAHNFQSRDDQSNRHGYLANARFTFNIDGDERVFETRKRTAFVHHLQPGPSANILDIDIAMVKLGVQYEYNRPQNEWEEWEKQEQKLLQGPQDDQGIPSTATLEAPALEVGKSAKAIIYSDPQNGEINMVAVNCVINAVHGDVISLQAAAGNAAGWPLPDGSSGCIVLVEKTQGDGNFLLSAIHFAGDESLSYALSVRPEAGGRLLLGGVPIIGTIGSYVAYLKLGLQNRANTARDELLDLAQQHALTIYIPQIGEFNPPFGEIVIN